MQENPLLSEMVGEHIAVFTLNRPDQLNAINGAMVQALEAAVEEVETNPKIRVAILYSSTDRSFSSGADLSVIKAGRGEELLTKKGGLGGFVYIPRAKPWIAAVRGYALGGGLELALACEMVVAGSSAKFGLPEVKRGIVAAAGGTFRLPKAIPRAIALELIATGASISADRAYQLGLINRVVPDDQVRTEALALAEIIAANAPIAVQESLAIAKIAADNSDVEMQSKLNETRLRIIETPDAHEGLRAFFEKRPPVWRE